MWLIIDLDGPLLNSKGQMELCTESFLTKYQNKHTVIFASARPYRAVIHCLSLFQPDYVIANNGANIYKNNEMIYNCTIPCETVSELLNIFKKMDEIRTITVETGTSILTSKDMDDWGEGWNNVFLKNLYDYNLPTPKLSVESDNLSNTLHFLKSFPSLNVTHHENEKWIQIMNKNADKANAIRFLAQRHNVPFSQTISFGDDNNDYKMLRLCGVGVAVKNANEQLQSVADYVCDSNDRNGVIKWIKENVLP